LSDLSVTNVGTFGNFSKVNPYPGVLALGVFPTLVSLSENSANSSPQYQSWIVTTPGKYVLNALGTITTKGGTSVGQAISLYQDIWVNSSSILKYVMQNTILGDISSFDQLSQCAAQAIFSLNVGDIVSCPFGWITSDANLYVISYLGSMSMVPI